MSMTKILLGLVCSLALSACGPDSKPVTEPLTTEELKKLVETYEDLRVELIYKEIIFPNINELVNEPMYRQQLEKLTYGDFFDYLRLTLDEEKVKKTENRIGHEWEEKFEETKLNVRLDAMADSIIAYWDEYAARPYSYVSIELINFKKEVRNDPMFNIRDLNAYVLIRVKPLRGKVDKLTVHYLLFHTNKTHSSNYTLNEQLGSGKLEINTPFENNVEYESKLDVSIGYPGVIQSWYNYVCDTPVENIKRKCKLHINSIEVTVNGKTLNDREIASETPNYVYAYKKAVCQGDRTSSDYVNNREKFVKNFIDSNYTSDKQVYIDTRRRQEEYKQNPMAFLLNHGKDMTDIYLESWGWQTEK